MAPHQTPEAVLEGASPDLVNALMAAGASPWSALGMIAVTPKGLRTARKAWKDLLATQPRGLDPLGALIDLGEWAPRLADEFLARWLKDRHLDASLDLSGLDWVRSLPNGLVVEGDLILSGCASLIRLPRGLQVGGDLVVSDCPALQTLPRDFRIGGDLILRRCRALGRLSLGCFVGGHIDFKDCPIPLADFGRCFQVGGRILH
jgi:hypothetical protein